MNKTVLVAAAFVFALSSVSPVFAAKSESKMKAGAQKVGHAIMWGPKKIGDGFNWAGKKITGK